MCFVCVPPGPPARNVVAVLPLCMVFLPCSTTQAIMIGDDVVNDVGGAQECGMMGVLVRTGKYR